MKSNEGTTNEVVRDYTSELKPISPKEFTRFIKEKRLEYNEDNGKELSTYDLGTILGIKYEMFRKILNQQKPTKKRDCIIAICVALNLLPGEIDEALNLYQYMPALDLQNPRDKFIFTQINGDNQITVEELNRRLLQYGFPGLDIYDKRKGDHTEKPIIEGLPYKILKMEVRTLIEGDYYYGDPYDSLSTIYDPGMYRCIGDMYIENEKEIKGVHLIATSEGGLSAQIYGKDYSIETYHSLDETGLFKGYFIELQNTIAVEKKRLLSIVNDTRNYKERLSAKLIDGYVCVFAEEFNYALPEMHEYYVLKYAAGKYQLAVYNQSAFMYYYLSESEYTNNFGRNTPQAVEIYDSIDQLDGLLENCKPHDKNAIRYRMRKNAFKRIQTKVDNLYQDLKEEKVFIRNLDNIFENPADVFRYYEIEEDFKCTYDEEYGEISDYADEAEFQIEGKSVRISAKEVFEAFKLGFDSIVDICKIKEKNGSIDSVL